MSVYELYNKTNSLFFIPSDSLARMATDIMVDTKLTLCTNMVEPLHNTLVDPVLSAANGLLPPQTPGGRRHSRSGNFHMRSATVGYIAPIFEGKNAQKVEG